MESEELANLSVEEIRALVVRSWWTECFYCSGSCPVYELVGDETYIEGPCDSEGVCKREPECDLWKHFDPEGVLDQLNQLGVKEL